MYFNETVIFAYMHLTRVCNLAKSYKGKYTSTFSYYTRQGEGFEVSSA